MGHRIAKPVVAIALALGAGCYRPSADAVCISTCTAADRSCPDGQACGSDLRCKAMGAIDCSLDPSIPDAAVADAISIDSGPDAISIDGGPCLGSLQSFKPVCPPAGLTPIVVDTPRSLETSNCMLTTTQTSGAPSVCVVLGSTITISDTLTVTGTAPVVFVATESIDITTTGTLDVGSHRLDGAGGPGNPAGCASTTPLETGGGPGGSYQGTGGNGGKGSVNAATGATAAVGRPTALAAGCAGDPGGGSVGGVAGLGGGAVYLLSGGTIEIDGHVIAGGGGAGPAGGVSSTNDPASGGGGGGAGGMIAIEASTFVFDGKIYAEGGSGSCGAIDGDPGTPGFDGGMVVAPGAMATEDSGSSFSGPGGDGSFVTLKGVDGGDTGNAKVNSGGGGGGGGAGWIIVRVTGMSGNGTFGPAAVSF